VKLQTITTIELSSICNLACLYCVNRLMVGTARRLPMIMSESVFKRCLHWLDKLCAAGTQQEINLNGNGESCLDPELPKRIRRVREVVGPERKVQLSTNGVNMSAELALKLSQSGVSQVHVSTHQPHYARRAAGLLVRAGVAGAFTYGPTMAPHNWAGQLESENEASAAFLPAAMPCHPLIEGRGYVQAEGDVVPCCYDYRNLGRFGHVNDEDLDQKEIKRFALCDTCHQIIPEDVGGAQ
jgi:hypothetical protein